MSQKQRGFSVVIMRNSVPASILIDLIHDLDFQSSIKLTQLFLHCQGNCLCSTVNNRGKVIYCYGDLVPRGDEILGAEAVQADGGTSSNDLLLAQLGVCTFGICVL